MKNEPEHNPDGLTPEQVGEGWRLLRKGEMQQVGDEWKHVELDAFWNPVRHWMFGKAPLSTITYRRRVAPEQALPATGDAARIAELEGENEALHGKLTAAILGNEDELTQLRADNATLSRQLAEARAEGDDYADAVFERWTQAVANLANEIVGKPGDFDSSPGETEDETRRYILGQVLDHIEEHISDLRAQLAASEKENENLKRSLLAAACRFDAMNEAGFRNDCLAAANAAAAAAKETQA